MPSPISLPHTLHRFVANGQLTTEEKRTAVLTMVQTLTPEELSAFWKLLVWWRSMPRAWRSRS